MSEKISLKDIPNHEDNIYADTLNEILRRCKYYATIVDERGWAQELTRKLQSQYDMELDLKDHFIRSLPDKIKKAPYNKKNTDKIRIRYLILYVLLVTARYTAQEIANFKEIDASYNPNIIHCAFRAEPYPLLHFIRTYTLVSLNRDGLNWKLCGDGVSITEAKLISAKAFQMKGDRNKKWLRIRYEHKGTISSIYLAEVNVGNLLLQHEFSKLSAFFLPFLNAQLETKAEI